MASAPRLRSPKDWLRQLFYGMCMGVADVVPGISGGTVAFIMGFYEDLLKSIKSFRFPLKNFAWDFLLATVIGIAFSIICMANFITSLLNHDIYRIYLYSGFMGLILASILFCAKQVTKWHLRYILAFVVGATIAFIFSGDRSQFVSERVPTLIDPWLIICGVVAISALLLPGVSGSYMLTILGVYPSILAALASFVNNAKVLVFDIDSFLILANLGAGLVVGAILFSRVISWLLANYHQITLSLLTGFLAGSLRVVWPYQSIPTDVGQILLSTILIIGGFTLVFVMESMVKNRERLAS